MFQPFLRFWSALDAAAGTLQSSGAVSTLLEILDRDEVPAMWAAKRFSVSTLLEILVREEGAAELRDVYRQVSTLLEILAYQIVIVADGKLVISFQPFLRFWRGHHQHAEPQRL